MDQNILTSYLEKIKEILQRAGLSDEQIRQEIQRVDNEIQGQIMDELIEKLPDEEAEKIDENVLASLPIEQIREALHADSDEMEKLYVQKFEAYLYALPEVIEKIIRSKN